MKFTIPELSFVVLIGVSGSGKSTFARKHFKPTEILTSDACRGLVSDDENSQAATKDAFEVLHFIARKRLAAGKLTVVDATNVQPESRKPLVKSRGSFIACRSPLFWICQSASRTTETNRALTGISARMSFASKHSSCIVRCAGWSARAFATSMC